MAFVTAVFSSNLKLTALDGQFVHTHVADRYFNSSVNNVKNIDKLSKLTISQAKEKLSIAKNTLFTEADI